MRELSDPGKCIACKFATEGRDVPVSIPQRHFVTHILRYTTSNKGELLKPLSFKIQAWSFSNDKFNMLTERQKNHGKLRGKDLIITCTEKNWQRYDIDVAAGPALWLMSPELKQRVGDIWKTDRHLDIDKLLCRKVDAQQMKELVQKVITKAPADIQAEALASEVGSALTEADLEQLLGGIDNKQPLSPPQPLKATGEVVTTLPPAIPSVGPTIGPADPTKVVLNFDDILNLK